MNNQADKLFIDYLSIRLKKYKSISIEDWESASKLRDQEKSIVKRILLIYWIDDHYTNNDEVIHKLFYERHGVDLSFKDTTETNDDYIEKIKSLLRHVKLNNIGI